MSNPARELHDLYSDWRARADAQQVPFAQVIEPMGENGSREIVRAARLLSRIDGIITDFDREGRNVSLYRRQFPSWLEGMIAYRAKWDQAIVGEHVVSQRVMDDIEGFANYLEGKVYEFDESQFGELRAVLEHARKLLEEDDSLDPALRLYIHRLLQEIENALDDAAVGAGYDFADGAQRLWVAFRAAESASTKRKAQWADMWRSITVNAVTSGAVELAKLAITMAAGGFTG